MKATGNLIRIVAIIVLILLSVAIIGQYALSAESLAESKKDLKERIEEHEDTHASKAEKKDCSQCESYKESQRSYERNGYSIIISAVQTLLIYSVYCFILFGIGVLISKPTATVSAPQQPKPAPQTQVVDPQPKITIPQPILEPKKETPTASFCTKCGMKLQADSCFCPSCGAPAQR